MNKRSALILLACLAWLAFSGTCLAGEYITTAQTLTCTTGSATMVKSWDDESREPSIQCVKLSCTVNASGTATVTVPALFGAIERVVTNPTGTVTDDWDMTLADADGMDLFCGLGTNRDTTTTESFCPLVGNGTGVYGASSPGGMRPVVMAGTSTLTITAAGTSTSVVIRLYLKKS